MSEVIAYNCDVCGAKTYCNLGEPYECGNGCNEDESSAVVTQEAPKKVRRKKKPAEDVTDED